MKALYNFYVMNVKELEKETFTPYLVCEKYDRRMTILEGNEILLVCLITLEK